MHQHYAMPSSSTGKKIDTATFKGTKRRLRLLFMAMLVFLGWAVFTFWKQTDDVNEKLSKLVILEDKLSKTKEVNAQYKQEITRLNDSEYIEQRVRKDFQMTRPGETLYIAPKSAE